MKSEKIKNCQYCQKQIIEGTTDVALCVVERQRPSTVDYPKNLNRETKDIFYHQDCYKEKHGIFDIKKIKEELKKSSVISHYRTKGAFKIKE